MVLEFDGQVAAVPNIPWHLADHKEPIKRPRLDSILLALPQACIVHLARHWEAQIIAAYKKTQSAPAKEDHENLGAVTRVQFVHGSAFRPPNEPFVRTYFVHHPIYDIQGQEREVIERFLRWHVHDVPAIKHEAIALPSFARDRPFHPVQFRLNQIQLSQTLDGRSFYRQALNFVALPQEPVPEGWAALAASSLCLTARQYQTLLAVAGRPEAEDTKRKRGQNEAPCAHRTRAVAKWLLTDLSLSDTCTSGGYKHTPFWDLLQ
jgi:hypothetical protein